MHFTIDRNNLLESLDTHFSLYPLELVQCGHCTFIQLSYIAPKEVMFDNYFYVPSISVTYLAHFKEITDSLITQLNCSKIFRNDPAINSR